MPPRCHALVWRENEDMGQMDIPPPQLQAAEAWVRKAGPKFYNGAWAGGMVWR